MIKVCLKVALLTVGVLYFLTGVDIISIAESSKTIELGSKIDSVMVYPDRAMVTRVVTMTKRLKVSARYLSMNSRLIFRMNQSELLLAMPLILK
ncbi:MAG: hypothetical protein WC980_06320 [Candidatus Brocadiia bacterium]